MFNHNQIKILSSILIETKSNFNFDLKIGENILNNLYNFFLLLSFFPQNCSYFIAIITKHYKKKPFSNNNLKFEILTPCYYLL